ncbi:MAG: hypothetical protein WBF17_19890, partial [Phycisphaerae bacterium]
MTAKRRLGPLTSPAAFVAIEVLLMTASTATGADAPTVALLADRSPGPAARHGLEKLSAALKAKGVAVEPTEAPGRVLIAAGLAAGSGPAAKLHKDAKVEPPQG